MHAFAEIRSLISLSDFRVLYGKKTEDECETQSEEWGFWLRHVASRNEDLVVKHKDIFYVSEHN